MSRSSINLSKTSQNKLSKFERALKAYDIPNDFIERTTTMVRNDVRLLRECSEKSIVDFYIETTYAMLDKGTQIDESFYTALKNTTRSKLARKYTSNKTFDNNIDIYFNEVKREYIKCPQSESDDLEFLPENRDIFISNNLKLVIECAKRYRNLGLPFEDLIQIGNYGLLIAFEKFDTERASLRAKIMSTIRESELDAYTHDEAEALIRECFTYSKNLEKTVSAIPEDGFLTKEEFLAWVRQNVKTAVFASVAFQWIRAYIILELNRLGKIIRIPKSARDSEDISHIIINLDAINPHTDDCYHDNQISEIANEEFIIEDEYIENAEKQELFRDFVDKVLYKLSATDRRIIMSHFGIGKPYQLSVQEIAEQEGLSVNKVKYSIAASMRTIHDSVSPQQKEMILSLLS